MAKWTVRITSTDKQGDFAETTEHENYGDAENKVKWETLDEYYEKRAYPIKKIEITKNT